MHAQHGQPSLAHAGTRACLKSSPSAAHAGTHIFQPTSAFVPIAPPRGLTIICHPPLAVPITKKEQASTDECRATVISALPLEMQPAPRAAE